MRLLVVSQYFWPEEFRVNDLVAGLRERGHEVTVLTNAPSYPAGQVFAAYKASPQDFSRFHGADVIRVPVVPRGKNALCIVLNFLSFVVSASIFGAWKLRKRRFDAVFCFQTTPITAALPAILLSRIKRVPFIMWVLDLWPESLAAIGAVKSPILLKPIGGLVRFIYRRANLILIASKAFSDSVSHYSGNSSNVEYFPNWIEPVFQSEEVVAEPEVADYSQTFNVMFAGNLGEAQDIPAVLDAAEETRSLPNLRWLIVGDGRRALSIRQDIERRSLTDRVVLLGRYPSEKMPGFFVAADALLVSLKDDPLFAITVPGKVQSYLAAGKPVLAMLTGEGARIIAESGGGLVSPAGNSGALAANLRRLYEMSTAARDAMGRSGREYAQTEFGRDRLLDKLQAWLELDNH